MAHHEETAAGTEHEASEAAPLEAEAGEALDAVEGGGYGQGEVGTSPTLPKMPEEGEGGFDYWLFGLLVLVAALVAVQNLWLRRRAQREGDDSKGAG
jgi:hypothetical protein